MRALKAESERLREDVRVLRSLNSKVCADEIDSRDDYRKILSDALRLGISEI
jgi:hypothetical protein